MLLMTTLAGGAEAQAAGRASKMSGTGVVSPGGRAVVRLTLHLATDTCRLEASSGQHWRTLSTVNPERTNLEWSWRVPAHTRSATWHLQASCESERWSSTLRVRGGARRPSVRELVEGWVRFRESGAALPAPAGSTNEGEQPASSESAPSPSSHTLPYYVVFSLEDGNCTDWANHERPDIYEDRSPSDTNSNWDAWTWPEHARAEGLTVNQAPEVGAIAVWPVSEASPVGHVAYVEALNPTGDDGQGEIVVSEMNYAAATEEETHYYEGIYPYDIRPVQDPSNEGVSYIHQR